MYFKTLKTNLFPEEVKKPGSVATLIEHVKKFRQRKSVFFTFDRLAFSPESSRVLLKA